MTQEPVVLTYDDVRVRLGKSLGIDPERIVFMREGWGGIVVSVTDATAEEIEALQRTICEPQNEGMDP